MLEFCEFKMGKKGEIDKDIIEECSEQKICVYK